MQITVHEQTGPRTITSNTPVIAIKHNNVGSDLIGAPELAAEGVVVVWDAAACSGELRR